MSTRFLMILSAVFLAAVGLVASFAPAELLSYLKVPQADPLPLLVQLLGASYLGFAITNWTAKDSMIGGIYARPLSLGNCMHFFVGALALAKQVNIHGFHGPLIPVFIGYSLFAVAFANLVFRRGMACKP